MFGQNLVQISSKSEMVKLKPSVKLTRNDPGIKFYALGYTVCLKKNVLTLKRYSSKLQGAILMKFGRNIQNTLE